MGDLLIARAQDASSLHLRALRQLEPNLPVILASGYDKAQVMSSPTPERPQVFLNKPYDLQQLRDALGQALATSSRVLQG